MAIKMNGNGNGDRNLSVDHPLGLSSNSTYSICCAFAVQHFDLLWNCCGLVVQLVVQQMQNKSNKWSLSFNSYFALCDILTYSVERLKDFNEI